jgi:cell division protein FtsZ
MGGGTGTGAAPVIAEIAREKGILTVGVVTIPFSTEGGYRKQYADEGIAELKKYVDTLLVINNEKLIEVYGDLTFTAAFAKANEVLNTATKGIAEIISQHLLVNIDLNDARNVLQNSGTAVMGQAKVEGENRAIEAVIEALDSPLLNDNDITGAQQVLLKIVTGGGEGEIKMSELAKIKNKIQEAAGRNVNIIEGIGIDPELGMAISVTVIATGFEQRKKQKEPTTVALNDDNFDVIADIDLEDEVKIATSDIFRSSQQTLLLDDEIDFEFPETETSESATKEVIESVVVADNASQKIVFDLGNDYGDASDIEESADAFISSIILDEEPMAPQQIVALDLGDELEEEPTLNTFSSTQINSEVMKIESREREERLRNISMQLRTPSGLTSLEDIPAYQRNNIKISEPTHSSESEVSIYTLTNGNSNIIELKQNNSFLHDNVD